jgi:WD40 repeat protein
LDDNVHIVSGSLDGTMRKWDCNTGLAVGEPWEGEGGCIWTLALSPDGRTIACGREDGSVQQWNTEGEMIKRVWTGHNKAVRSLSWSPWGSNLASGCGNGIILVRKAESGEVAVGPIKTGRVMSLAYSPSERRIASGGDSICIWDSNTGELLVGPIEDLRDTVTSVVWSSDSSKLYSASDEFARVFDSASGALLHHFKHDTLLYSVAFSPKHNVLACTGSKGVAQLWDTESYEPLGHPFRQDGDTLHYIVSFSPNGRYLACGGNDNKITLWMVQDIAPQLVPTSTTKHPGSNAREDTQFESPTSSCLDVSTCLRGPSQVNTRDNSPKRAMASGSHARSTLPNAPLPEISTRPTPKHIFDHQDNIWSFVFLHDNAHIVSGSWDGTMCKWNCDTGLLVGKPWKGEGRCIWALALSPDGRTIACGRGIGSVQQRNTDGEMIEGVWTGYSGDVRSLSWSPTGSHLASGSEDGTILIRKAKSGAIVVGPIETDQSRVRSLAFSPPGDRIASGGDKSICIWDSNTGKLLVRPIEDLGNTVTSVVWSSDSSKLYSASDEFARVFDSVSGTLLHRFPHHDSLWSVALSPKHNVLACVGDKGAAQLWDTETYEPHGHLFRQDGNTQHSVVSFSSDGQYLAYGGMNNNVALWILQDIAPQLIPTSTTRHPVGSAQEETESPSSSCLDVSTHTFTHCPAHRTIIGRCYKVGGK